MLGRVVVMGNALILGAALWCLPGLDFLYPGTVDGADDAKRENISNNKGRRKIGLDGSNR